MLEVSIIDDRKYPAYLGTSIEMRDDKVKVVEYRTESFSSVEIKEPEKEKEKIDYSDYEKRIEKIKKN